MNKYIFLFLTSAILSGCNSAQNSNVPEYQPGSDIETFWSEYARAKGGLTWGSGTQYPDYDKVNEGDTLLIQLDKGPCLMEFFHNRWRRANDVWRWDDTMNQYGGCPYVFD